MEKDPRIQYARSRRTEEEVDEDRDFDEWRTDPELRFVHERCMARREKRKEKEREEKEKARKEKEEKERKERDGWIEEYRNRPGGAEEREATQRRIEEDREKYRDFGAPAPRSGLDERQRQKPATEFPAIDCREGVKVCGEKEDDIVVQESEEEKRKRREREEELKRRERWEEEFLKNEAELSRSAKSPAAMNAFKRSEKGRRRQFFAKKEAEQELERKRLEEQQEHFVIQAPRKE